MGWLIFTMIKPPIQGAGPMLMTHQTNTEVAAKDVAEFLKEAFDGAEVNSRIINDGQRSNGKDE